MKIKSINTKNKQKVENKVVVNNKTDRKTASIAACLFKTMENPKARIVLAAAVICVIVLYGNPITGPLAAAFTVAAIACKILLPFLAAKILASAAVSTFVFNLLASDCFDKRDPKNKLGSSHIMNNITLVKDPDDPAEKKYILNFTAFIQDSCLVINRLFRAIPLSFTLRTLGTYAVGKIRNGNSYTFSKAYHSVRNADKRTFDFVGVGSRRFANPLGKANLGINYIRSDLLFKQLMLGINPLAAEENLFDNRSDSFCSDLTKEWETNSTMSDSESIPEEGDIDSSETTTLSGISSNNSLSYQALGVGIILILLRIYLKSIITTSSQAENKS